MTMLAQASAYGDPLYQGDINAAVVGIAILKVVVCFVFLLVATMFMVWFERKVIAGMQNRIGPEQGRAVRGPADPGRRHQVLLQGGPHPERADPFVFRLAPYLAFVPAFLIFCVVPIGGDFSDGNDGVVSIFGHDTLPAGGRPAGRHPVRARPQLDRGLRRHAGGLVVGLEVPAARLGAGHRPRWSATRPPSACRVATVLLVAGTLSTNGIVVAQDDHAGLEHRRHGRRALRGVRHRRAPPSSTARRSTWWRPSRSSSAASTPSTPRSASPSSTWPSS